jgi:hypothetical protein
MDLFDFRYISNNTQDILVSGVLWLFCPTMCLVLNEQGHALILRSQQLLKADQRTWWWWCIATRGLPTPTPMCSGSLRDIEHIVTIGSSTHHLP